MPQPTATFVVLELVEVTYLPNTKGVAATGLRLRVKKGWIPIGAILSEIGSPITRATRDNPASPEGYNVPHDAAVEWGEQYYFDNAFKDMHTIPVWFFLEHSDVPNVALALHASGSKTARPVFASKQIIVEGDILAFKYNPLLSEKDKLKPDDFLPHFHWGK